MTLVMVIAIRISEGGGPKFRRLNCSATPTTGPGPVRLREFLRRDQRLMPQRAPKRIFYIGVTNLLKENHNVSYSVENMG
jgi:hypothetical protein